MAPGANLELFLPAVEIVFILTIRRILTGRKTIVKLVRMRWRTIIIPVGLDDDRAIHGALPAGEERVMMLLARIL
jgi:hypothetical protein